MSKQIFNTRLLQTRLAAMKASQKTPTAQTKVDNAEPAAAPKEIRVSPLTQVMRKGHLNPGSWQNILSYWFPILIVLALIGFAVYHFTGSSSTNADNVAAVEEKYTPEFDMVRVQPGGGLVVTGKFLPETAVQVEINKKVIGNETTNKDGEFAYTSAKKFKPGNYVIRLLANDGNLASKDSVFVYIASEKNGNSLSLLMTKDGSKFLQAPESADGTLSISKIDYIDNGTMRISGRGLPRLNITASLDGKILGASKVGDNGVFGIDAEFENFRADRKYSLEVKMTDDVGNAVQVVTHNFILPESRPGESAYYSVKKGDCLWIISRKTYGRGILYTMIFDANTDKIKDPHWIYPKQVFVLPEKK